MSHLGQIESDAGVGIPVVVEAPAASVDVMENVGGGVTVAHDDVAGLVGKVAAIKPKGKPVYLPVRRTPESRAFYMEKNRGTFNR